MPVTERIFNGKVATRARQGRDGGAAPRLRPGATARGAVRSPEGRANFLGWFSIGLGLAEIIAPRRLARAIGVRDDDRTQTTMLALGLREIMSGVGILTQPEPTRWVWARVAGDLIDLALMGQSLSAPRRDRDRALGATAALAGVTLVDALTAVQLGRSEGGPSAGGAEAHAGVREEHGVRIAKAITVGCTPEQAYGLWRDLRNLPRFMTHLESVEVTGDRSHWRLKGPAGTHLAWDAELSEDLPNRRLGWRSVPGAGVMNEGLVTFREAPGGRGTEVRLELRYEPPMGGVGTALAKLFKALPSLKIENDLRNFKQLVELGELAHSDASVHLGPHPARPSDDVTLEAASRQLPQV
ncbi:MAG TPA: SRPBCC family protein [Polyangiaceae bacterium]|nr:SRPBCC family protein [Polyangiaceae bacterium]